MGFISPYSQAGFLLFGETILLTLPANCAPGALTLVQRLDAEWGGGAEATERLSSLEYRARYVPLQGLASALDPYRRTLYLRSAEGHSYEAQNIGFVEERSLVLARGTSEELQEIAGLLARIDVPQPQVRVTSYLLRGSVDAEADVRLPADLVRDLAQLVPYESFELLSFGMFQCDAVAPIYMEESVSGGHFQLEMNAKTFEPSVGVLTLDRCSFELSQGTDRKSFMTSARITMGEYTVLGALGNDPVFVVLKIDALPQPR